jgi:hypothetical protein
MGQTPLKSKSSFFQSALNMSADLVQPGRTGGNVIDMKSDQGSDQKTDASPWKALTALGACVWRLDLRSGRTDISAEGIKAFEHVFNVDPQCLDEGRFGFSMHTHPDDRDRLLAMLAARIDHSFHSHFRVVDREGAQRWISLKVAVSRTEIPGQPIHTDSMWFLAQNDTREKAEEERQKRLLANRILSSLFGADLSALPAEEFSSQNLMEKISAKWRPLVEEKKVRWIGPDLAPMGPASVMEASEPLLMLLMDSLFENAIEASLSNPHPGIQPWVRFEFFEDNDSVFLAISDSGPGVPLIHRGQIFEPFFSTRPEHTSGLGLTLARSAAEWHKGGLRLDHYSKNTRFVAQIPKRFGHSVVPPEHK